MKTPTQSAGIFLTNLVILCVIVFAPIYISKLTVASHINSLYAFCDGSEELRDDPLNLRFYDTAEECREAVRVNTPMLRANSVVLSYVLTLVIAGIASFACLIGWFYQVRRLKAANTTSPEDNEVL